MPEIPQLQDESIFQPQNVSSNSSGYDAFAQVLGNIAGEAGKKAEQIEEDHSQAMYIHSVANIEQLKTSAKIQLLEHPDQAAKVAENMQSAADMVKQAAYVNDKDRIRLDAYIGDSINDIDLSSAKTSVHQSQLMASYTHYANWPDQIKAYQQALTRDDGTADNLKDAMVSSLKNLLKIGALSPEQAANGLKSIESQIDLARHNLRMYGDDNVTAKDFHTINSSTIYGKSDVNTPVDQNTAWMINSYSQDRSFQGVLSDLYNRKKPSLQVFDSLEPAQREHAIMTMQGVMQADGLINSGSPLPTLQRTYDELNEKHKVLNYREQGLRNSLGNYLNQIKSGDYLGAIESTPGGAVILHDYINRDAAIRNSSLSDSDKQKYALDNLNNMVSNAISYGYGHHFTHDEIQPIPIPKINEIELGFKAGSDPSVVIDNLSQFKNENKPWVAKAMKNPRQQVVINTLSLAGSFIKPSQQLDYIAANQEGRSYLKISESQDKHKISDPILSGLIVTQKTFQDAMSVVRNQYNSDYSQIIQNELINSAVNYVKYQAEQQGDFTLKNRNDYIRKASDLIGNAYPKISGTNYIGNPRQLNLTTSEMDILANYAIKQGNDYLKDGVSESVFMSAQDRNSLKMSISPTNEIRAIDGNNKVYWHAPFSPTLLGAAKALYSENLKKAEEYQKKMMMRPYGAIR